MTNVFFEDDLFETKIIDARASNPLFRPGAQQPHRARLGVQLAVDDAACAEALRVRSHLGLHELPDGLSKLFVLRLEDQTPHDQSKPLPVLAISRNFSVGVKRAP